MEFTYSAYFLLNQWIGNSFSLASSLRYSEIYQNKYICDVNLFAGAFKMLGSNVWF